MAKKGGKKKSKSCLPKKKCCVSKDKCGRCPLLMLKDGTLPDGLHRKKRTLVSAQNGEKVSRRGPAASCLTGAAR